MGFLYTAGDSNGGLVGFAGKRVAVIGTGASAIQGVPHVGRYAKHLYVVQRPPSPVDEPRTDPAWAESLTPGWQRRRRGNFVALTSGMKQDEDLVATGERLDAALLGVILKPFDPPI